MQNKKLEGLVENILSTTSDDEAICLWNKITSEFGILDVVWAHKRVSTRLVGSLMKSRCSFATDTESRQQ